MAQQSKSLRPALAARQSLQRAEKVPAPPVYKPQPTPRVLQKKAAPGQPARGAQTGSKPGAPPVYRPQPVPRVLQTKTNKPLAAPNAAGLVAPAVQRKQPQAPAAYRPQPTPKVLQRKMASGQPPLPGVGATLQNGPRVSPDVRAQSAHTPSHSEARAKISTPRNPPIQRKPDRAITRRGAPARVIQRITSDELKQLPQQYREIFNEWIRARTLPIAERPDKYKDPEAAAKHFLNFIPSIAHLKDALDVYIANKKADRERDDSVLSMLPHSAATTIASSKTLKECGVNISGEDLSKRIQILNDEAFFKVNVNRSIDKLKHIKDPYDLKVVMGAWGNEETKAFTDKGIAYFKNDIHNSTVVHETLHLLCRTPVTNLLGGVMAEGMTELLTQWACEDAKANYTPDYIKEKKVATAAFKAVGLLSKSAVARAYFTEPKEMASLLEKKMGTERFKLLKSTSTADDALKLFES